MLKSVSFLYSISTQLEVEMEEISFRIVLMAFKYLKTTGKRKVYNLCEDKCNTILKDIRKDLNK